MFKFVANHNDEQAITMFMSNLKHGDRKQKERNKSVPWEILMLTQFTIVVESNIIFSYFQAIKITLLTKCLTILSNSTSWRK